MTYAINQELNGVELYFDAKPERSTLDTLKANHWRWNNRKQCWYNRKNEDTVNFAAALSEGKAPEVSVSTVTKSVSYHKQVSDYISLDTYRARLEKLLEKNLYGATLEQELRCYNSDNDYHNLSSNIRQVIIAKSLGMDSKRYHVKYQAVWPELPTIEGLKPGNKYSATWGYDQTQITTATHYGRAFGLDVLVTGGFGPGDVLLKRIGKDGTFSESCMYFTPNTYTEEEIIEQNTYTSHNGR